jgi:APA family basic amino acid/polyamine antiporter
MALHRDTLAVGAGWMALGLVLYMLYRRAQGLPITRTVKVVLPEPLGVEEVEYRSVLVAFRDNQPFSKQMVATAVKLASKRRRGVHIHAMITVPTHLPLDAELEDQESEAQSKIEEAKLIGGLRVTGHVERIRPGQSGYAIAEEAREIKAAAIVVGLRFRDSRPLYDDTLRTVLAERPCRVIVVSDPAVDGVSRPRRPLVSAT